MGAGGQGVRSAGRLIALGKSRARRLWLHAQRLDEPAPFGAGPEATRAAVEHLGYVQIDTINVVERCHHQILYTRIPAYQREDLRRPQSVDKTVFEYWTHALAYVPTRDLRFYVRDMYRYRRWHHPWFGAVKPAEVRRVLERIRKNRALQLAFYRGLVTISERTGMLKTYELMTRHFGFQRLPAAASEREIGEYLLERALRSQALV